MVDFSIAAVSSCLLMPFSSFDLYFFSSFVSFACIFNMLTAHDITRYYDVIYVLVVIGAFQCLLLLLFLVIPFLVHISLLNFSAS